MNTQSFIKRVRNSAVINLASIAIILASLHQPARADDADTNAPKYDIIVANGNLILSNGGAFPATLGTVIDKGFRVRFPHANFTLAPGLEKIKVGDFKLANLGESEQLTPNLVGTALEAVQVASGNSFTVKAEWPTPDVANSGMYYLEAGRTSNSKRTVAAFNLSRLGQDDELLSERRQVVMDFDSKSPTLGNDNPIMQRLKQRLEMLDGQIHRDELEKQEMLKTVQDQVKATLATLHLPDTLEFNYNPNMHLLVVVGTEEQIDVTRTILDALLEKPAPSHEKTPKLIRDDLIAPK